MLGTLDAREVNLITPRGVSDRALAGVVASGIAVVLSLIASPSWSATLAPVLCFTAVMVATWWGGLVSGATATWICIVAVVGSLWQQSTPEAFIRNALGLALFVAAGLGVSFLGEARHQARVRERSAHKANQKLTQTSDYVLAFTEALSKATVMQDVTHAMIAYIRPITGASFGWVSLEHAQQQVYFFGHDNAQPSLTEEHYSSWLIAQAAQNRTITVITAPKDHAEEFEESVSEGQTYAAIPLSLNGDIVGAIGLVYRNECVVGHADIITWRIVALSCVQALERLWTHQRMSVSSELLTDDYDPTLAMV